MMKPCQFSILVSTHKVLKKFLFLGHCAEAGAVLKISQIEFEIQMNLYTILFNYQ